MDLIRSNLVKYLVYAEERTAAIDGLRNPCPTSTISYAYCLPTDIGVQTLMKHSSKNNNLDGLSFVIFPRGGACQRPRDGLTRQPYGRNPSR